MFEFYLLLFLFPLYYADTIIPISDLQNVTVYFVEGYCNYTLRYKEVCSSNFKEKTLIIRIMGPIPSTKYVYVYDDYNKLINDKAKNDFKNYFFRGEFYYSYEMFEKKTFGLC